MSRFRPAQWGAAAAAAAVTATVLTVAPIVRANVAPPPAPAAPTSFVPITPCRLADTRPAPTTVGTRATPIGESESVEFAVRGQNGQCTIPASASGIATNVTAVNPTAAGFVTLFPADVERPLASNLNLLPGGAPTPNQVTVKLSDQTGAIRAFNRFGSVDLIIDIVGYYTPSGAPGAIGWGTTVTGEAFWDVHANGQENARDGVHINLPGRAPVALTEETIKFGPGISTSQSDPLCTGTVDEPTAPPGLVCIYTDSGKFFQPMPANVTARPGVLESQGFRIWWRSSQPDNEDSVNWFTWAYTAPATPPVAPPANEN